jgi:hypothetical protein
MTLNVAIEDFLAAARAAFLTNMAAFLQVPVDRVTFVEVYPGSVVVRFKVLSLDAADYNSVFQADEVNRRIMTIVRANLTDLSAATQVEIADVNHVSWAVGLPTKKDPEPFTVGLSEGAWIAIGVCAALAFFTLIFLVSRFHRQIKQYREFDHNEDAHEGKGVVVPQFQDDLDEENRDAAPVRLEGNIKSLRIRVDESDEDELNDVLDDDIDEAGGLFTAGKRAGAYAQQDDQAGSGQPAHERDFDFQDSFDY